MGDSKLYILPRDFRTNRYTHYKENGKRKSNIIQLTEDHTLSKEMTKRRRGYIERSKKGKEYEHALTRCLGGCPKIIIEPFIRQYKWKQGDYLLLCTDGLSDMLGKNEIFSIVYNYSKNKINTQKDLKTKLQLVCNKLITKANDNGGLDNITAILIEKIK